MKSEAQRVPRTDSARRKRKYMVLLLRVLALSLIGYGLFWLGSKRIGYEIDREQFAYHGPLPNDTVRLATVFGGYLFSANDRQYYITNEPTSVFLVYGPGPYWIAGSVFYFNETEYLGEPAEEPLSEWKPELMETRNSVSFTDLRGLRHELKF